MLILSRRVGESIIIGGDTILRVDAIVGIAYILSLKSPTRCFQKKLFHSGDRLIVGDHITFYFSGSRHGPHQMRISVQAPRDIPVDRGEIWLRKQEETLKASRVLQGRNA